MNYDMFLTQPMFLASASIDLDITVVFQFVTFALVTFSLYFLFGRRYLDVRQERDEGTEGSREEAEEMQERAEQLLGAYEEQLATARRDAMEVRDSLRSQGVAEQADTMSEAREEIGARLDKERAKIAGLVEAAEADLEGRAQQLATLMAQKVLPS